jgi:hypothetical protein
MSIDLKKKHSMPIGFGRRFQVQLGRDGASTLVALGTGGVGIVGTLVKKCVPEDMALWKKTAIWVATTVLTVGFGSVPFLIACPGISAKKKVQETRAAAVDRRLQQQPPTT